ncbi:hypothetical protein [Leptospira ryugenii]|uniref:hypothetical protein n=1 Tax=Leptospira ryugenii TaxID=1917863 RepID=UPI000D5A1891|nr:hypothetical protein [Leptospira ryugenii]
MQVSLELIWSTIAILLTVWGYAPYLIGIYKGTIQPHYFSWLIWGLTTCIVFFAQFFENGGLGSYPTGVSGILTLMAAYLSWQKRSEIQVLLFDWYILVATLTSLPIWYLFSDPMLSVILLTVMDLLGFLPSFRKAMVSPFQESTSFYFLFFVRNIISIFALTVQNVTTVFFPLLVGIFCFIFVVWVYFFRWRSKRALNEG